MAEKTIAEKLQFKPGAAVWLSDQDRASLVGPLPPGASLTPELANAGAALLFADDAASLKATLTANENALGTAAVFWVAYPKANRTDINRDSVWPILAEFGMRPISQVAIDQTWSALRFRKLRPGEAPFTGGAKD